MNRKAFDEEKDMHENSKVAKTNIDIKRAPLFSHYIWTHDIHSLANVKRPQWISDQKSKETKMVASRSQGVLDRIQNTSVKKPDELLPESDDEKGDKKPNKPHQKKNSIEKLTSYFENVDKYIQQKKPDNFITEKVDEMAKEVKSRRTTGLQKYQEIYYELFGCKQDLPANTNRKNQEFLEKIAEIQRDLRPETHKLPALFENNGMKIGSKAKPTKVIGK